MLYQDWIKKQSFGRHLILFFIIPSLLICFLLIIITGSLIGWVNDEIKSSIENTLDFRSTKKIQALSLLEASLITSELEKYVIFLTTLKNSAEIFQNFSPNYSTNPFVPNSYYLSTPRTEFSYNYGIYYSENIISAAGYNLIKQESCFNNIYPTMYYSELYSYYEAYYLDQIFYGYPADPTTSNFNPLVRGWFYTAVENKLSYVISEPYRDYSSQAWVLTISRAILDNENNVYGVAALDFQLSTITQKLSNLRVLGNGFAILISKRGIMINPPESWNINPDVITKIYDEVLTGISLDLWNKTQLLGNEQAFSFTSPKGINYNVTVQLVQPFVGSDEVTHYIFFCAETKELLVGPDFVSQWINPMNQSLYAVVVMIGVFTFGFVCWQTHVVRKLYGKKLRGVENVLESILDRANFVDVTKKIDFTQVRKDMNGIRGLAICTKAYVEDLRNKEMFKFRQREEETRPADHFLYDSWKEQMYPRNRWGGHLMEWRFLLKELD